MNRRGSNREREVADDLRRQGFFVVRSAGSHGPADLVALRAGAKPRLVQVKSSAAGPFAHFGPAERRELLDAAIEAGAEAVLVHAPPRGARSWLRPDEWPAERRSPAR